MAHLPSMGVCMQWYKSHVISNLGLPLLHAHINVMVMKTFGIYSSRVTFHLMHSTDKCKSWYMNWFTSVVRAMDLGGKEFGKRSVCVYGASLGFWPWLRRADDVCSFLAWIGINTLLYPWDRSTKALTVQLCSLTSLQNKPISLLHQCVALLVFERTIVGIYRCVDFQLVFGKFFSDVGSIFWREGI